MVSDQQSVLPQLEQRLRDQCLEICQIAMPSLLFAVHRDSGAAYDGATSASRIAELPALLLELGTRKDHLERENETLQCQIHNQLVEDLAVCKDIITIVAETLTVHKLNDQPRVLEAKAKWLAAVSRTMQLKAQILAAQLTVETYPSDEVEVLRATR